MQETVQYVVPVELREADEGPTLHGVVLQEGRAAQGGRAESFAPLSVVWPATGIALLAEHRGTALAHAVPVRDSDGSIRVQPPASAAIVAAFNARAQVSLALNFIRLSEESQKRVGHPRNSTRAFLPAAALGSESRVQAGGGRGPRPEPPQSLAVIDIPKLFRRKAEVRASYADQVVAQIMSAASAASDGSALAAIETSASRWWGSGTGLCNCHT